MRASHGPAGAVTRASVARAAAIAIVVVLAPTALLSGCGGGAKVSDVAPHSTPEITPPEAHTPENADAKKTRVTTVLGDHEHRQRSLGAPGIGRIGGGQRRKRQHLQ